MAGEFIITLGDSSQLEDLFPDGQLKGRTEPRMAFVGRSNVGKSTLINRLLEAKVAQTSNKPGKTRAIHFYLWKNAKKLVADLPGYGFAAASKGERERWSKFVQGYFDADGGLERAVVLLDARHGPTDNDIEALTFLRKETVPVTLVFTKLDQVKTQADRARRKKEAARILGELGYDFSKAYWVSVKENLGLNALEAELKMPWQDSPGFGEGLK